MRAAHKDMNPQPPRHPSTQELSALIPLGNTPLGVLMNLHIKGHQMSSVQSCLEGIWLNYNA